MSSKPKTAAYRLRRYHLASVSLIALGLLPSVEAQADEGPVDIVISTPVMVGQTWSVGNFTVTDTGSIVGASYGVSASTNGGIFLNDGSVAGGLSGVTSAGLITTFTNNDTIEGGTNGVNLANASQVGTFTNGVSGVIKSTDAHSRGLNNSATITSLINEGSIYSETTTGGYGINNAAAASIGSITNSGLIKGNYYAIFSTGVIGPIENSGTISGNIYLNDDHDLTFSGGEMVMGTLTGYADDSIGTITM